MDELEGSGTASFEAYVEALIGVIGHADRAEPLQDYCMGLMMPVARKGVEPLAAVTAPARVSAKRQSLLHFVGQSANGRARWPDPGVDHRRHRLSEGGRHSVGVARQYCGQLGK